MKRTNFLSAALMYGLNILSPCLAQYNVGNDDGFAYSSVGSIDNEVALSLANLSVDLGNDTTLCAGNLLDAGNSGATYLWQDNSTNQTFTVTASGTYYVQVTDSNSNTASDTIIVTVNTNPSVPIISKNGNVLTSNSAIGNQWYKDGNPTADTTQTYTATANGNYYVIVTNSDGCSATSSTVSVTGVGINAQQQASGTQFQVYPNPSDGNFDLQLTTYDLRLNNAEVRIYNVLGEKVYQQTLNFKHETLNTKLTQGVYFLQLATEEGMWNEKVIVQ